MQSWRKIGLVLAAACHASLLAACTSGLKIAGPHEAPIPKEARMLLGKKGMTETAPIFIRIFKAESELEVWKLREDGHFHHFKTYPICHWSGTLGPKIRQGDKQSPEGFYRVNRHQLNPNSSFHLSFDLGYPNAYDRAHGRTGNFLMVHGKCKSAGCYAMTDGLMEEIYALAREAFAGGQQAFHVHAFPFRMTEENLARYRGDRNAGFWRSLKQGYDYFEITRQVPNIEICERRYRVNVEWVDQRRPLDARGRCPRFREGPIVAFQHQPPSNRAAPVQPAGPIAARPAAPAVSQNQIRYHQPASRMSLVPEWAPKLKRLDPITDLIRK